MEEIRRELELLLADSSEGTLSPASVLAYARANEGSAIRQWLDAKGAFDPARAAEQFALIMCRDLIRRVKITIIREDTPPVIVRAFTSLNSDRTEGGGYRSTETVLTVPQLREQMIATALAELNALRAKYASLKVLDEVWAAVERVETTRRQREQDESAKKRTRKRAAK